MCLRLVWTGLQLIALFELRNEELEATIGGEIEYRLGPGTDPILTIKTMTTAGTDFACLTIGVFDYLIRSNGNKIYQCCKKSIASGTSREINV